MEKNVQLKYRLYRRVLLAGERFGKAGNTSTIDKREAERLLNAMNESHRQPTLDSNLEQGGK
jgi:hypothetical protein